MMSEIFDPLVSVFPDAFETMPTDISASKFVAEIKNGAHKRAVENIRQRFKAAIERGTPYEMAKKAVEREKKKLQNVAFAGVLPIRSKTLLPTFTGLCRVMIDGAPSIHCVHESCGSIVDATEHELRSQIGKAEWIPTKSGKQNSANLKADDTEQLELAEKKLGLSEKLAARKFNIHARPPEVKPRFFIGTTPVSTAGNITAISAGIKSGKSSFIGAMLAATMANEDSGDCLGVVSRNLDGLGVMRPRGAGQIAFTITPRHRLPCAR